MNRPDEEDDFTSQTEQKLDSLLRQAAWPDADPSTISRMHESVMRELHAVVQPEGGVDPLDSQCNQTDAIGLPALDVPIPGQSSDRRRQFPYSIAVSALMILVAFAAGRWSASGRSSSVPSGEDPQLAESAQHDASQTVPALKEPPKDLDPDHLVAKNGVGSAKDATTEPNKQESLQKPASDSTQMIEPRPELATGRKQRLTPRERMKLQLEDVLVCLSEKDDTDGSCCRTLLPRRAEFEFMLGEVIRNATGQRQLAAVTAMGFVGTDTAVPVLLGTTRSESLREKSIAALKQCCSEQMLAGLVLQPGDETLQREFLTELAHRSTPNAVLAWLHLMRTPRSRILCQQAASDLSPFLVDAMFRELDAPLMDDRISAILSLGRRTDKPTQDRIMQLIQQFPNRWEPVAILMCSGSETAVRTLTKLQKNPERFAVLQTASIQLQTSVTLPDR